MPSIRSSLLAVAAALTLTAPAARAEKPQVPEQVRLLSRFVGKWKGNFEMRSGDQVTRLVVSIQCVPTSAGWAVQCKLSGKGIPGMERYEETDLLGWDPSTGYHLYSVTNAGETHDHRGTLEGDVLTLEYTGTVDGKPMTERIRFQFRGDKEIAFQNVTSRGDHLASIEGTFRK